MHAIVIAGGKGARLGPLTAETPKALMRFGEFTLLEITLLRLREAGADRVTLCVSHLGEMIRQVIGSGDALGIAVEYCYDPILLGTAGPLRQVPHWDEPALVMNCDILTALDFGRLYRLHVDSGARLTVATQRRHVVVPFGVVEFAETGHEVRAIKEKPSLPFDVSAGIYVVDPKAKDLIPMQEPTDMPALMRALLEEGHPVQASPFTDVWHDIGTPAGYQAAQRDFATDPTAYLMPKIATPQPRADDLLISSPLSSENIKART
jgi:NDP-sugar pyrophosphorylase family protein